MKYRPAVYITATILLAACRGDATPDDGNAIPTDTLAAATEFGGINDNPEYEFGAIAGIRALDDGGIAVVDRMNNVVRIFDGEGKHSYSFGRKGAGPGELEDPCCPGLDHEGLLWIRDGSNSRYNAYRLFADSAAFVRQLRMSHSDVNRWAPTTFDSAGRLIDIGTRSDPATGKRSVGRMHLGSAPMQAAEETVAAQTVEIHEVPTDSTGMKSVERVISKDMKATMFFYPPYSPTQLVAHSPTGEFAHMLSSRYEIDWRDERGNLIRHLTGDVTQGPQLTAEEKATADKRIDSDATRAGTTRMQLGFSVPERKQPVRRLFFDQNGRLWVELTVVQHTEHLAHVYARDGTLERKVTWPAGIELSDGTVRDDVAWGVRLDSLDVASIVKLKGLSSRR
jgi:hypothetical protein